MESVVKLTDMIYDILRGKHAKDIDNIDKFETPMTYNTYKLKEIDIGDFNNRHLIKHNINDKIWQLIIKIIAHDRFDCNECTLDDVDVPFVVSHFRNGMSRLKTLLDTMKFKNNYKYQKIYQFKGRDVSLIDMALMHNDKEMTIHLLKHHVIPTDYSSSQNILLCNHASKWHASTKITKLMKENTHLYMANFTWLTIQFIRGSIIKHGYESILHKSSRQPSIYHPIWTCNLHILFKTLLQCNNEDHNNRTQNLMQIISEILSCRYSNNEKINHPPPLKKVCLRIITDRKFPDMIRQLMLHELHISSEWETIKNRYKSSGNLYEILYSKYQYETRQSQKKKLPRNRINDAGHEMDSMSGELSQQSNMNAFMKNHPTYQSLDTSQPIEDINHIRYIDWDYSDDFELALPCKDIRCLMVSQIVFYKNHGSWNLAEIHSVPDEEHIKVSYPFRRQYHLRDTALVGIHTIKVIVCIDVILTFSIDLSHFILT